MRDRPLIETCDFDFNSDPHLAVPGVVAHRTTRVISVKTQNTISRESRVAVWEELKD